MAEPRAPGLMGPSFCRHCGAPLGGAISTVAAGGGGHACCLSCRSVSWRNPLPVAGVLLVRDGHVLLTRRSAGMERGAGRWAFPGGFVEAGETAEEAALRGTREEAGVDAAITGIVGRPHSMRDPGHLVIVYRGVAEGEPRPGPEVSELRWFAPAQIPWTEIAFPTTEAALRDLLAEGLDAPAHPLDRPGAGSVRSGGTPKPPPFCQRCGGSMRTAAPDEEGHGRCSACDEPFWANPASGSSMHVIREGRVLLARRDAGMSRGAGLWTGPGGHIDLGESAEEAVARELAEEVGLDVAITGLTGVYSKRDPPLVYVSYRGTADGAPHAGHETEAVRWFAPGELPWGELFADAVAPLRDLLAQGLD